MTTRSSDADRRAQGCDFARPARAYLSTTRGSHACATPTGVRMLPGLSPTGFGSTESSLAVARDGSLFFAPAFGEGGPGVLRSRDHGLSFELLAPKLPGGLPYNREQAYMFMDPVSERLFFHTSRMRFRPPDFRAGFHFSYSDDQGETWHYQLLGKDVRDWAKLCAGPRPRARSSSEARVHYFSAPAPISTRVWPWVAPKYHSVYRSYDGGSVWQRVGKIDLSLRSVAGLSRWEWILYGNSVVAPDGSLYLAARRGPRVAIAKSVDEGETFQIRDLPGAHLPPFFNLLQVGFVNPNYVLGEVLSVDTAGNLYALWPDHEDRLRLAVSADGAQSWSDPVVVSAPEVKQVLYGAATVKEPGTLAIAYHGSSDGKVFRGYLAESTDVLCARPTFVSATIDPPHDPLYPRGFDVGYDRMIFGGDLNEFIQVKYAPNGDILASFCKRMQRTPGASNSWDFAAHADSRFQGVLGRLVHV